MFNKVMLIGRIRSDLLIQNAKHGNRMAEFELVVTRNYLNNRGIREFDSFNCIAWNKAAENLAEQVKQGSLVLVSGSLQKKRYKQSEILVEEYSVLEGTSALRRRKFRLKVPPKTKKNK